MSPLPHHKSRASGTYRDDWPTPEHLIQSVHGIFGRIDIDLASSAASNVLVGAKDYYSRLDPCPDHIRVPQGSVLWCNPPGPGSEVKRFWRIWCRAIRVYEACGAFLIYNIDHWRSLERPPTILWAIPLPKRLKFEGAKHGAAWSSALVVRLLSPQTSDAGRAFNEASSKLHELGHVLRWEP